MICVICREGEVVVRQTAVTFERGEFSLLVNSVPAAVCPNCGEAYVDETTAGQLLRIVGRAFETGESEGQCEYVTLQI